MPLQRHTHLFRLEALWRPQIAKSKRCTRVTDVQEIYAPLPTNKTICSTVAFRTCSGSEYLLPISSYAGQGPPRANGPDELGLRVREAQPTGRLHQGRRLPRLDRRQDDAVEPQCDYLTSVGSMAAVMKDLPLPRSPYVYCAELFFVEDECDTL